jgi:predicted DNA-binding transcriptional regulator AlpA
VTQTPVTLASESVQAIVDGVVDLLVERGLVAAPRSRVLDVEEVADMLGRHPDWVYDHKAELGAFRFGDGPRARIGFDERRIRDWMRSREIQHTEPVGARPRRPRAPIRADPRRSAPLIPYDEDRS